MKGPKLDPPGGTTFDFKGLGKDSNLDLKHHQHISVVLGLGSHGRLS